jgi:hypothetical protein
MERAMTVSIHVDFSNGVMKSFFKIPTGLHMSVTQALDAAMSVPPGLTYEFDAKFIDRGGREVGAVKSIDGVVGAEDQIWGVWVNDRAVSDLRRVTDESVTPFGGVSVEDGDVITFKLMKMD